MGGPGSREGRERPRNPGRCAAQIASAADDAARVTPALPGPTHTEPRHESDLISLDQPPFWRFAGNERFRFHEDNLRQVYGLERGYLSGSHGNIGSRVDIDFEPAFIADMKAAVGKAMSEHPFMEFVNPSAKAHTEFLSKFFAKIADEATATFHPKYGSMYGFEEATPPNAEMVARTMFEYRWVGGRMKMRTPVIEAKERWLNDPVMKDRVLANSPIGRMAEPEDIAALVLFLATELSSIITHAVYPGRRAYYALRSPRHAR